MVRRFTHPLLRREGALLRAFHGKDFGKLAEERPEKSASVGEVLPLSRLVPLSIAVLFVACSGARTNPPIATSTIPSHAALPSQRASFTRLYSFSGAPDGLAPESSLVNVSGTLYGTTYHGGIYNNGTIFTVDRSGNERVLHSFGNRIDGELPIAGLINVSGTLYGTTEGGGKYGWGSVYRITPSGAERVLYSFNRSDGAELMAPLTYANETLYGTASAGGTSGGGVVFGMSTSGSMNWEYSFGSHQYDGSTPYGGLAYANGLLYGTTLYGGTAGGPEGYGTVFSISPSGTGEKILHSFAGAPNDGMEPVAGLTYVKGLLYGTTADGGAYGEGIIFSMTPSGTEAILHDFGTTAGDGITPWSGPLLYTKGRLFGTTWFGGHCKRYHTHGICGTVFRINLRGSERVVHYFQHRDGENPVSGLITVKGTLYGTTSGGGAHDLGTVFALTP